MASISENWLGAEPLLVQRLKAQAPALRAVYTPQDLTAVEDDSDASAKATPAAHVFYLGDRISPSANASSSDGSQQMVDQLWAVALVLRNYRSAADARLQAGALIPSVIKAIAGWDCGIKGMRPFRRAPLPSVPKFYENGKAIFPLIFSARVFT